jgi:hypothetical protein
MPKPIDPKDPTARKTKPRECIFCGAPANSEEHVWPNWMRHFEKRKGVKHMHRKASVHTDFKVVVKHERRSGRAVTLNITCTRCNNGWISIVDANAKGILLALKNGRWGYFTPWQRRVLAAWATRFAMVYEYVDPDTVAASPQEREFLRLSRYPPPNWHVFVGYYRGIEWADTWNHRYMVSEEASKIYVPSAVPNDHKSQSTVFVWGQMILNVVSGRFGLNASDYATTHGLRIVWPESFPTFGSPLRVIDDAGADDIAYYFGGRAAPW